jgi:hypothetical protein
MGLFVSDSPDFGLFAQPRVLERPTPHPISNFTSSVFASITQNTVTVNCELGGHRLLEHARDETLRRTRCFHQDLISKPARIEAELGLVEGIWFETVMDLTAARNR